MDKIDDLEVVYLIIQIKTHAYVLKHWCIYYTANGDYVLLLQMGKQTAGVLLKCQVCTAEHLFTCCPLGISVPLSQTRLHPLSHCDLFHPSAIEGEH